MSKIAIYTLTSELHDEAAVTKSTKEFLDSLNLEADFKGGDYSDYGQHGLNLIYVRTGGTEGVLKPLLPQLLASTKQPVYLLTSGKSNSLAASMEILSYLRQNDIKGEILHGSVDYIRNRVAILAKVEEVKKELSGMRLGVIGEPSDWLISSNANYDSVKEKLGIELVNISMDEMKQVYNETSEYTEDELVNNSPTDGIKNAVPGALRIYKAIKTIVDKYELQGFTIRCFDLLTAVKNTGCIALAKLNSEGIIAGCEGDVPSMLSMAITKAITGVSGFQANPAHINPETGEILVAHCTIPFNMLERYELDTHFESGIGIGIRGFMKEGPVTIFKVSGDVSRHFVAEAQLVECQGKPDLCRTQMVIQLNQPSQARYFLTNPIGNHHIVLPGHYEALINEILR